MIAWIDDVGKSWGLAKRRVYLGGYFYTGPDDQPRFHADGWSDRSVLDKLREERDGAGQGAVGQRFAEVMTGEALEFARALSAVLSGARARALEHWFDLAVYRYVIPNRWMPPKSKLAALKSRHPEQFRRHDDYYDELHALHCALLSHWPAVSRETDSSNSVAACS